MRLSDPVRPLFARMVALILLFLIPMYGVSYYLLGRAVADVEARLLHSIYVQAETTLKGIEEDIERVINQCYRLINNQEVLRLANIPSSLNAYERVDCILGVRERLITIGDASPLVEDITMLLPSISRSISIKNGLSVLTQQDRDDIIHLNLPWGTPLFADNPQYWLRYPMSQLYSAWFAVRVDISLSALRSELAPLNLYEGSFVALLNQEGTFRLADGEGAKMDWIDTALEEGDSNIVTLDHEEYLRIRVDSVKSPISIAVLHPRAQAQAAVDQYRTMMFIFTLLGALLMALTVESVRRVILRPMSRMMTTQEAMTHRAELKQLQSQINPHFLYNVFFTLGNIAQAEDSPETLVFAQKLGQYFKYITRNSSEFTPLSREVEHALLYAQIQQTRFSNRIEVAFEDLPEEWAEFQVPRLFLQPFLENAFEHGFENKAKGGLLRVRFFDRLGRLTVTVEDNGEISDATIENMNRALADETVEVTAVVNIHRRLSLIYGDVACIAFERSEISGLAAKITLTRKN